ncbi:MAG: hypothetical protein ABL898_00660 [Hyphomicrobiaceae bacterium]|nr:hypothetical protein [Hyphomicrobiaceae bacterium]
MVRNGFYRVFFGGTAYTSTSIFVLKDGQLLGFSFQGSEYTGTYAPDPVRKLIRFEIAASMPPGVMLVTGQKVGAETAKIKMDGEAPIPDPTSRFSFDLAGKSVDVAMHYMRPLL